MPRRDEQDDLDEEDLEDREDPDPSDTDPDYDTFWGSTNTIECPYCDEEIAEEAEWCPHCGKYISKEDSPRRSVWIVVGFVLFALVVLVWLIRI